MHKYKKSTIRRTLRACALSAACAGMLAACGGGGGGGDAAPVVVPPTLVNVSAVTQGFWSGSVTNGPEASTRASAIIMPDLTAWIAFETTTAVVGVSKMAVTGTAVSETTANISGSGSYYSLTGSARQSATSTGTVTSAGAINATTAVGATNGSLAWTTQAGYTTPATAANATGTFTGNLGGGAVSVTWTITGAGTVTGTSTTGCQYAGTLKPNAAAIAVYDVAVSEDCNGTVRALAGISTFRAAAGIVPASLRVIFTADAGATGGLLALDKQ
jgi:hypothetical protein